MGNRDKSWRYAKRQQRVPVLATRPRRTAPPAVPAPALVQLWTAWARRTLRSPFRCVVAAAMSEDHARERLQMLTRGQYVEATVLPGGEDPNDGPRPAA